ncbi:MAG: hypothetical protein PHT94_01095 [Candidatus Nanoarchaeia archaeon]|nr:hypothetical protein [Candidatus Nanoarchaeia archaeon]
MALIHRWPLTKNANDVVGGLHLTNNGTVTFSVDGASFNGSNQWLSGTKSIQTLSFSLWVKFSTAKTQIAFGFCGANYNSGLGTKLENPVILYGNGGYINSMTSVDISDGRFHCVVVTRNAASTSHALFIDGVQRAGTSHSFTMDSNFAIGRLGSNNDWYYAGVAADARIYDNVLSESEALELYTMGPNYVGVNHPRPRVSTPVILSTMPTALTRGFR